MTERESAGVRFLRVMCGTGLGALYEQSARQAQIQRSTGVNGRISRMWHLPQVGRAALIRVVTPEFRSL